MEGILDMQLLKRLAVSLLKLIKKKGDRGPQTRQIGKDSLRIWESKASSLD